MRNIATLKNNVMNRFYVYTSYYYFFFKKNGA
jgi:hypothetical protein